MVQLLSAEKGFEETFGLKFIRWAQKQFQMNNDIALDLLDVGKKCANSFLDHLFKVILGTFKKVKGEEKSGKG